MPCNSDYLGPTNLELKLSHVRGLLQELETGSLPDGFGPRYLDDTVYNLPNRTLKKDLDEATAELCSSLKKLEVLGRIHTYSLELQIWWRDHKLADAKRERMDLNDLDSHEPEKYREEYEVRYDHIIKELNK